MTGSAKRKGDRAELGVQALIRGLLGWPARRKLGAGRLDDIGDIDGVPDTVIQVADWRDAIAALREKPRECEVQQARAGATFGATFLRLRGGEFRVVLTPEQWAVYARESLPVVDEWDCTHCGGEGTCDDNADPLWDCDDQPHPCHACGGSGLRSDQTIF